MTSKGNREHTTHTALQRAAIKADMECTYHRDGTVSYWSVYRQCWSRTTAYDLCNRHNDYAALNDKERKRISNMALRGNWNDEGRE